MLYINRFHEDLYWGIFLFNQEIGLLWGDCFPSTEEFDTIAHVHDTSETEPDWSLV